jgi:hypothetical protein
MLCEEIAPKSKKKNFQTVNTNVRTNMSLNARKARLRDRKERKKGSPGSYQG